MTKHYHYYPNNEKLLKMKPNIIFSGILDSGGSWSKIRHSHMYCEILYVSDGSGVTNVSGKNYNIKKGDLIIYNKGVWHGEHSDAGGISMLFFAVKDIEISGLEENHLIPDGRCPVMPSGSYDVMIENMLKMMVEELEHKNEYYKAITTNIAEVLLCYILRFYAIKAAENENVELCEKIRDYLEKNYKQNITVEELAAKFYLSKFYMLHLFKETMGVSPMKYLQYYKMKNAMKKLSETDRTITEIACSLGYEDGAAFSRVFKRSAGLSPSEYRERARSEAGSSVD